MAKLKLTEVSHKVALAGYKPMSYRRLYYLVLDGKLESIVTRESGKWFLQEDRIDDLARLLGLSRQEAAPKPDEEPKAAIAYEGEWKTTTVHLKKDQWKLLRAAARKRADVAGSRASVSEIIRELIEQHIIELRA